MVGVSLIETLLVVALVAIILLIYLPSLNVLEHSNDSMIGFNMVVNSLKRAQVRAISGENDSVWGVKTSNGLVTIFRGNDFVNRNKSFDENLKMPRSVNVSGLSEVVFTKLTGRPMATGTMTISIVGGASKIININEQGVLDN